MRRTTHCLRSFYPILLILWLVTACSPSNTAVLKDNSTATPSTTNNLSLTCPASLHLPYTCVSPGALREAYGVEPLIQKGYTGKGQTIIDIVSFGSPTLKADMDVYDKTFNLPPTDLQIISPLNEPEQDHHNDKIGWGSETTLDVQAIHALAPEAKIIVLESPVDETEGTIGLPEFRKLEQYVIDHKLGNIVTHSWGASELTLEDAKSQAELKLWEPILQQGTLNDKITYFSSSGDNGPTDYQDLDGTKLGTVPSTSFVASSPWTTSVGGTRLLVTNGKSTETAWTNSGGGFSRFFSMPDYQKLLPADTQAQFQNRRGVPDVAALADPATGLPIYVNGTWGLIGGTSASAPQWAAIMAIANQMAGHPLGFINPALYKIATSSNYNLAFNDVTSGSNDNPASNVKGYPAIQGWDPATGLGSPNAVNLIPTLIATMNQS